MTKSISVKSVSLARALAFAVFCFSAGASAQTLPCAAIGGDIAALKAAREKVEASAKAQYATALKVDMAALKAAAQKLRSDVRSVKDGLASQH
jgi:hypothetical protein